MVNFYLEASLILARILEKKVTIKAAVMNQANINKKQLFAIICQALKYRNVIILIINQSKLLTNIKQMSMSLAILLVHDLLFGKLISSPYKQKILLHKTRLNAELIKIKIKMKVKNNEDLIPKHIRDAVVLPRYIRVNTLKTSVNSTLNHFKSLGYSSSNDHGVGKCISQDIHLKDLLVLPPNIDLHEDAFFLKGNFIIQDKASCFPAFILNPPPNSIIIDACVLILLIIRLRQETRHLIYLPL
jgi:putative methyltransferase